MQKSRALHRHGPESSLRRLWAENTCRKQDHLTCQAKVGPGKCALRQKKFWTGGLTDKQVFLAQMECGVSIFSWRDKREVLVWFSMHSIPFLCILCPCCSVPELAILLFLHQVSDHFQNSKTALGVSTEKCSSASISPAEPVSVARQCWTWDPCGDLHPEVLPLGKLPTF